MGERVGERGAASGIVVAVAGRVAVGVDRRADAARGVVDGLRKALVGVGGFGQAVVDVVGVAGGVASAVGRGEPVVVRVVSGGFGGQVRIGGGGEASVVVVGVAGLAVELVDGQALCRACPVREA